MKKNLKKYIDEDKICVHTASKQDIDHLLQIVDRDLSDASVTTISADRRHATAYNAALQLATIVLHASGYRAKSKIGHHWVTIMLIPEIMGKDMRDQACVFNAAREKRNITDYDYAGHVSEEEVEKLLKDVQKFKIDVVNWLKKEHTNL
jgi:uncharacterized protein (UPF0332 family)